MSECKLFSCSVGSNSLQPHRLQHARIPCPSPFLRACSNACPLSQWCHPTILSSAEPFSFCLQSFPASGSFPMSWLFPLGSESTTASASASVLPMNIQNWYPLGLTSLISLMSQVCSRVFFSRRLENINSSRISLLYGPNLTSIYDYWKNHSFD